MNTQINLTDNELQVIKSSLNFHKREDDLIDNHTFFTEDDIQRKLNWNKHQVAGLISAMLQKKVITYTFGFAKVMKTDKRGNVSYKFVGVRDYFVTSKGINAYFDAIGE